MKVRVTWTEEVLKSATFEVDEQDVQELDDDDMTTWDSTLADAEDDDYDVTDRTVTSWSIVEKDPPIKVTAPKYEDDPEWADS